MTTDDLIARLTGDLKPVSRHAALQRIAIGLGLSAAVSALLMWLWLGMRPDLMEATGTMSFWAKLAYVFELAIIGVWMVKRIAYPLGNIGLNLLLMGLALAMIVILALAQFAMAPRESYYALLTGQSLSVCTLRIVVLSLPLLVGILWILRGLAPTRLTLAGGAAGLAAGAIGSLIYSFHCMESAMPFIAIWYTLGVLVPGLIGAIVGRYVLRW
jgi:hypothetical protein